MCVLFFNNTSSPAECINYRDETNHLPLTGVHTMIRFFFSYVKPFIQKRRKSVLMKLFIKCWVEFGFNSLVYSNLRTLPPPRLAMLLSAVLFRPEWGRFSTGGGVLQTRSPGEKSEKKPKKRKQMQLPHLMIGNLQYMTFLDLGVNTGWKANCYWWIFPPDGLGNRKGRQVTPSKKSYFYVDFFWM